MTFGHFIGIGSNIRPRVHFPQAIHALQSVSSELTLSRVLETQAEGFPSRSPFLNAVAYLRTGLSSQELKERLNIIEGWLGRDRKDPDRKLKDRPIDLDVLLSLLQTRAAISIEQVPDETYYRPQMLELIHMLGFTCCIPATPEGACVEIEFDGEWVGSRPVQIACSGRLMRAASS